jgi:L-alanine-DL-glutamate epimerase-like enolase superfamily enzyme
MQDMELAREIGLKVMVGCMVSSSLAIAPAFSAAQLADYWDLDGFLSLSEDRSPAMRVEHGEISLPAGLWC